MIVSSILLSSAFGQSVSQSTGAAGSTPANSTARIRKSHFRSPMSNHAENYYFLRWGVDSFSVKLAESGEMVRFSWRVLDPVKAAALNDKKAKPALIDPRARVSLEVPSMEKVGQLRQTGTPEEGRKYWMAFSNRGRPVKSGDRVTVVIGNFRVDGLLVE
jgi:hypothetical protein